jgi:cell division protein FtsN
LKPYLAIVACVVVAAVVVFTVLERWALRSALEDPDAGGAVEGAGRVVIGPPPAQPRSSTRHGPKRATGDSTYKAEDFTFYKSLGNQTIPAPKLDPRPAPPSPAPPKAAAKAKSEAAPRAIQRPRYTVQVGSFRDRASADRLAVRLRRHHSAVSVTRVLLPTSGVRYRVRVGMFKTRQDARRVADTLKTKEKLSPFVALVAAGPS